MKSLIIELIIIAVEFLNRQIYGKAQETRHSSKTIEVVDRE
jgi:hypothetical protein